MRYTCLLMVLCECACGNLISNTNFNLINKTDLFICLPIIFQFSFRNSKELKIYRKVFGCSFRTFAQYNCIMYKGVSKFIML